MQNLISFHFREMSSFCELFRQGMAVGAHLGEVWKCNHCQQENN